MSLKIRYFGIVLIILLAAVLRLIYIDRPMRLDEANTVVRFASLDLPTAMSDYRLPNNHLLNTFFINLIYHNWGNHPILVRLPAFVAGILVLPAIFCTGKALVWGNGGVLGFGMGSSSGDFDRFFG